MPAANSLPRHNDMPPLAGGHAEACTERLVEMRQIVETATVGNFRDGSRLLQRVSQRLVARVEPRLEQPAAECLPELFEAQVQSSHRDAEVLRYDARR